MYRSAQLGWLGDGEGYFSALWNIVSHPLTASQVLTGNPLYSAIGPELLGGEFSSNAFDYVTTDQKNSLIQQEAANLIQASAGRLTAAQAQAQAQNDVTAVLTKAGADPSQNPLAPPAHWGWIAVGGAAFVILLLAVN